MKASLSQRFEEKVVLMVTGKRIFSDDQSTIISCQFGNAERGRLTTGLSKRESIGAFSFDEVFEA